MQTMMNNFLYSLLFFSLTGTLVAQELPSIGELKSEESETTSAAKVDSKEDVAQEARMIFEGNVGKQLDKKILYGSNMIYDCEKQYFACVDLDSYEKCVDVRNEDKKNLKQNLGCAPLKKYQYLLDCSMEQSKYIENSRPVVFCLNY